MEGQEWHVFWERTGPQGSVPLAQRSPPWGLDRHGRTRDAPELTLSWQGGQACLLQHTARLCLPWGWG